MMMMIWQKCTFSSDQYGQMDFSEEMRSGSKSEPVSPVGSLSRPHKLQRAFSSIMGSSRQSSILSSSSSSENIDQLEMLLEAYFVVIDNTLSKLSSLKEYIDDTEDLINIKLGEQNTWICSLGCSSCQQEGSLILPVEILNLMELDLLSNSAGSSLNFSRALFSLKLSTPAYSMFINVVTQIPV
ncbi:hypothetical protein SAY87_001650 [Trapa incisa]|uniref:Uncharacterized protein n=1 Tax=Trapa incisa TaxID=236973 RepID=A0AAN7JSS6_9MYRT|nr:hypothetical protein SAY87_001650 [Trapa incisa]